MEFSNIDRIIKNNKFDEIYNLAAQSFVGTSFNLPIYTSNVNAIGTLNILESIRNNDLNIKFYQASTSEMFGNIDSYPQNEKTNFYPRSPYGVSKLFAHWSTINYRESYDMFACSGIAFNHESPLRGDEFVTKKIIKSFNNIKNGKEEFLELGNLYSKRDWGFAGDYVEAMWMMLNSDTAKDYVISTGKTYSIKDFIEKTSKFFNFNIVWQGEGLNEVAIDKNTNKIIIKISELFYRPAEVDCLLGDSSKINRDLGWKPQTTIDQLIEKMCNYELKGKI